MSTNKIIQALGSAAGSAGGAGLNVEEVFSTYLHEGTSANRDIVNDIDLSTEGGAVWFKGRSSSYNHILYDTERGVREVLRPNRADANSQLFGTNGLTAFNANGFSITGGNGELNYSGQDYVSWTFRKASKFFDVVTYTGTGSNQTISHNLGTTPGMIVVKETSGSTSWRIWHTSLGNNKYIRFQTDAANTDSSYTHWSSTAHTDTTFSVGYNVGTNNSGSTYVAYLFAHNNGDGEFGPDADQDIIKCGSFYYTGNTTVNLGFEPQWILAKRTDSSSNGDWFISDVMRGWTVNTSGFPRERFLNPNQNWQESLDSGGTNSYSNSLSWAPTSTGFKVFGYPFNNPGSYIYIAIRRGPMAVPEDATDVFAVDQGDTTSTPAFNSGFVTDFNFYRNVSSGSDFFTSSRLTGNKYLATNSTAAESSSSSFTWDFMDGFREGTLGTTFYSWMWRRAPNFFDVVCYDGDATASPNSRDIEHNLGVAPEMMWIKCRSFAENWAVYHSGIGATKYLNLNGTAAAATSANWWRNTAPTDTVFTIGHQDDVNANGETHIAYLFASLDGISKVGSYTGNGSSQTIDCGFSSGARFVLIKGSSFADNWSVFDTERGIVAGDDPRLYLNTTGAQFSFDYIDPHSSGFTVNSFLSSNGQTYIFYAIA